MEFEKEILNGANLLTTTDESETQQELIEVNAPDTAPQGQGAANVISARGDSQTVTAAGEKQTEKEPFMVIRYNHENRNLSREEAITAAQKGIRFSNLAEKLDRLAAIKNVSAEAFIDSMLSNERDTYKNGLLEKFGGNCDTVEQLMKLYDIE
ncbi:MAG: hypothetical protein IKK24_03860 [Clostridia bacterium]|nr:hypothetical protein [Clostridia bacterium]